ncbi:T9SS type A sorting domain-containing protein [Labilibacter sediminis]|nr:T9SS type A sorting domain-containing protein [Labilibacter sediminis]
MKRSVCFILGILFFTIANLTAQNLAVDVALEYVAQDTFKVVFSESVNQTEAADVSNYTLSGTGGITGAPAAAIVNGNEVKLALATGVSNFKANQSLVVRVSGISSASGANTLDPDKSVAKYFLWHFHETMNNMNLSTSGYLSGGFIGKHGINWDYVKGITYVAKGDTAILLRYSNASYGFSSISTLNSSLGVGSFSFKYTKAWSSTDDRGFIVTAGDNEYEHLAGAPEQQVYVLYKQGEVNSTTATTIKIQNKSNNNREILVDDIRWTSYAPPHINHLTVTSATNIEVAFDQILVESTVSTTQFMVNIGGVDVTVDGALLKEGNIVVLTIDESYISTAPNGEELKVTASGVANYFNNLVADADEKTMLIEKPSVIEDLQYVSDTQFRLRFSMDMNATDMVNLDNYILGGTSGITGKPTAVTREHARTVLLTIPSIAETDNSTTLTVTVNDVYSADGIGSVEVPDNVASYFIDRIPPMVLPDLEFVDMSTFILTFSEPVVASDDVLDYALGGSAGITGNPDLVEILDSVKVKLIIPDISLVYANDKTLEITVANTSDMVGNPLDGAANKGTYIMDTSSPVVVVSKTDSIEHRSAVLTLNVDKAGDLYWSAYRQGMTSPSIEEILSETGIANGSIEIPFGVSEMSVKVDDLIWDDSYDVYLLLESREGYYSVPTLNSFTTLAPNDGFSEEVLGYYRSHSVTVKSSRIIIKRELPKEEVGGNQHLTIYNLSGVIVYSAPLKEDIVEISHLPGGLYIVNIRGEKGQQSDKIIIR